MPKIANVSPSFRNRTKKLLTEYLEDRQTLPVTVEETPSTACIWATIGDRFHLLITPQQYLTMNDQEIRNLVSKKLEPWKRYLPLNKQRKLLKLSSNGGGGPTNKS